jgi:hypothetical protein
LKREWATDDFMAHPEITLRQAAVRMLTSHLLLVNSRSASAFQVAFIPGIVVYLLFHVAVNAIYLLILLGSVAFLWMHRGTIVRIGSCGHHTSRF